MVMTKKVKQDKRTFSL